MRLEGKRAVVTAAAQGIGRAIAERFVADGAEVHASDIADLAIEGVASARRLDVTDAQAIANYAREIGDIDVLVNVAGWVHHGSILDCDDAAWSRSFEINVTSMHRMIRAFLPGLLRAPGGGSIVNMASAVGSLKGAPKRYAYGASKAAVIGLTKSIAADFAGVGLRCNAICPGTVESPSWHERVAALGAEMGGVEAARAAFVARQPMGRIAQPEEIAAMAAYLASDEAAFVTGAEMKIDGGWTV